MAFASCPEVENADSFLSTLDIFRLSPYMRSRQSNDWMRPHGFLELGKVFIFVFLLIFFQPYIFCPIDYDAYNCLVPLKALSDVCVFGGLKVEHRVLNPNH